MTRKMATGLLSLILSAAIFSRDFETFQRDNIVGKSRGIEVLNFYEPVEEQNSIKHYLHIEYDEDYTLFQWKLAEGYIALDNRWDFEYNIEREFYHGIEAGRRKRDLTGWDNLVGFVGDMGTQRIFQRNWDTDLGLLWEYNKTDLPAEAGGDYEKSELAIRYRLRTNTDIGRGGTYWGVDLWGAGVFGRGRDGYSLEANILSATNWGHGWQTFNTLYNEYYDYKDFEGTYLLGLESYTRWTCEFARRWAFTLGIEVDLDKYIGGTTSDYGLEFTLYPALLYNREVYPDLRFFAEIGLPGYRYDKFETDIDSKTSSGIYLTALAGVQYIW